MKKNLDWENIGFAYRPTDSRFVSMYTDGKWDEGAMIADPKVNVTYLFVVVVAAFVLLSFNLQGGLESAGRPCLNGKVISRYPQGRTEDY